MGPEAAEPSAAALLGSHAVLVPVKAFTAAKRRMAPVLAPAERRALARRLATGVLEAARPLGMAVVCDDREVADWARRLGALVIWEPGRGLNGAVEEGVEHLARLGARQVTVAHADLPQPASLAEVGSFEGVTLVPDRSGDGTNVISLPSRLGFRFSYGPGSFSRHLSQCATLGVPVRVLQNHPLSIDVDHPGDLAHSRLSRR